MVINKFLLIVTFSSVSLFSQATLNGDFGYKLGDILVPKNLKITDTNDYYTCYKIKHKSIGDLTNFKVCTATHGKKIIRHIVAESKMLKSSSVCREKQSELAVAIKNKYGDDSSRFGRVRDGDRELGIDCSNKYNANHTRLLGHKLEYEISDSSLVKDSIKAYKEAKRKKASSGAASKYSEL